MSNSIYGRDSSVTSDDYEKDCDSSVGICINSQSSDEFKLDRTFEPITSHVLEHASLISGCYNRILSDNDEFDGPCTRLPHLCAIVGGRRNTILNRLARYRSSVVVGCTDAQLTDCSNTVLLGLNGEEFGPITGLCNSTVADTLYTRHLHVGSTHPSPKRNIALNVDGNAIIQKNLRIRDSLKAEHGVFNTLYARHIHSGDQYIPGPDNVLIRPHDKIQIIYCNPSAGPINIKLGTGDDQEFETNRTLTIKDVTPEYEIGSSYNIHITVPDSVRLEHYSADGLISTFGGTYVLNSSGGSVTLRLMRLPQSAPVWGIESQFIGNSRILPSTGFVFHPATEQDRVDVLQ